MKHIHVLLKKKMHFIFYKARGISNRSLSKVELFSCDIICYSLNWELLFYLAVRN